MFFCLCTLVLLVVVYFIVAAYRRLDKQTSEQLHSLRAAKNSAEQHALRCQTELTASKAMLGRQSGRSAQPTIVIDPFARTPPPLT
jgi:hypothetical protein